MLLSGFVIGTLVLQALGSSSAFSGADEGDDPELYSLFMKCSEDPDLKMSVTKSCSRTQSRLLICRSSTPGTERGQVESVCYRDCGTNRVMTPVPARFLRIFTPSPVLNANASPVVVQKCSGERSSPLWPDTRDRRSGSSPAVLRGISAKRVEEILAKVEEAISVELIEGILSFPIYLYDEKVHGGSLAKIHAAASETSEDLLVFDAFADSKEVLLFGRMIAELLVEIENAKIQSREILSQAAPFVHCYVFLASRVRLPVEFVLSSEIGRRILQFPALYRDQEDEHMIIKQETSSREVGEDIGLVLGRLLEELETQVSVITMESPPDLFDKFETVTAFIMNRPRSSVEFSLKSMLLKLCHNHAEEIIIKLVNGLGEEEMADYRVTRVGIDLVSICKKFISLETRFSNGLPLLLQSAVGKVPAYVDGDVLFEVPQGTGMVETLFESIVTFDKLELMNEVFISFLDSAAAGHDGLRRKWLSATLEEMRQDGSLLTFSDSRKQFLKPVSGAPKGKLRMFGRMLGFALRYGVSPGIPLSPSCLWLLQNHHLNRQNAEPNAHLIRKWLEEEDPQLLRSLEQIKSMDFDESSSMDLVFPGNTDEEVNVNSKNVERFISSKMTHSTINSVRDQMLEITAGVADTVRFILIESLHPHELRDLIHGPLEIHVDELCASTTWSHPSQTEEPVQIITWLFEILSAFDQDDIKRFIAFVSGAPLPPIGGFVPETEGRGWLKVQFDPHLTPDHLPTARTCFIVLTLPMYETKSILETKLRLAIHLALTIEHA